ncbi:aminoglycoside adenylyltransferase domain-containing protein [Micromonospora qiuiae]|uniref:aminoglycoside adenylyltransferase domain-containing protein n=1 Tax=Micromonospora qiuiae TaxID=502268 RepID=UPI00194E0394|nr:aminoglycoside adenylyltransferase domain-containing protein [Micromonospora qiuiae]
MVRQAEVGTASGIDLHVVTSQVARAPDRAPALEAHIGRYDGSSVAFEAERQVAGYPDLLPELSMARADGRALRGAAPHDVIAPVPADPIIDRGGHWLLTWRSRTDDTEDAAFMVLTACRIWHFAVERVHSSKAQAARWALGRQPGLSAIRQAVQQYEHDPASNLDDQGIAELLDTVLHETTPHSDSPAAGTR